MNTNIARGLPSEGSNEASIADYLQRTPDFFERHRGLLEKLRLPHARTGATISLVERQVEVLRERNAALERKLGDLVNVGRLNDALAERMHRLCQRLVRARSVRGVIEGIETSLREDFDAKHAALVLFLEPTLELRGAEDRFLRLEKRDGADMKMFESLLQSGKPRCGQTRDVQRDYLFGKDTVEIGSAALAPIGAQGSMGILAIGSSDSQRFHPGMSTDFLARIAEIVGIALAR